MADEDEQALSTFPLKLTLQLGLHALDADESKNTQLFLNIAPMTFDETQRKPGDRPTTKARITNMVAHFRLLNALYCEGVILYIPIIWFQSN